jgi:hypothetical protein
LGLNSEIKEAETSSIAYTYIHKVDGEFSIKLLSALQMITAGIISLVTASGWFPYTTATRYFQKMSSVIHQWQRQGASLQLLCSKTHAIDVVMSV